MPALPDCDGRPVVDERERADLPMSKQWNDTSDIGRWKPEVRPYTYNKKWIPSERL